MYAKQLKDIDELKNIIDSYRPLGKKELAELKEYYRIGLTYTSNALEGNSLTETETKIVLEEGITIGGKLIKDHLEAVGHAEAYDSLYSMAKHKKISIKDILNIHKLFYARISPSCAGRYRKEQVFITGTDFIPPSPGRVPQEMKTFVGELPTLQNQYHPVEYAALAHLKFVTIHPFIDGNGRCARLLMNVILLQHGYAITLIPPIMRRDYINAIKQAQTTHDNRQFLNFIIQMTYESQQEYVRLIRALRN